MHTLAIVCIETHTYAHAGCMWHALVHSVQITHSAPPSEPKPSLCPLRFTEARSWVDGAAPMPRQRPRSHGPPGDALSPLTSIRPILGCSGGALWRLRTPPACRKRFFFLPGSRSAPPAVAASVLWQNCFFYEGRGWPVGDGRSTSGQSETRRGGSLGDPQEWFARMKFFKLFCTGDYF